MERGGGKQQRHFKRICFVPTPLVVSVRIYSLLSTTIFLASMSGTCIQKRGLYITWVGRSFVKPTPWALGTTGIYCAKKDRHVAAALRRRQLEAEEWLFSNTGS